MKVLVVDDSKAMRMIVIRTLRQAGFRDIALSEASNGAEALQVIESTPPDLVLSDWNMPEVNGIQLLQRLRENGKTVKFGFVTSECTPEMKQQADAHGALFWICKPFTEETFREALEPVMGS